MTSREKDLNKGKRRFSAAASLTLVMTLGGAGVAMADPSAGNIDPDGTGSLTVHKYAGEPWGEDVPQNPEPLDDVTFTLHRVGGLDVLQGGDWAKVDELNEAVAAKEATVQCDAGACTLGYGDPRVEYPLGEGDSQTTADGGLANWDPLDLGVYYVEEVGAATSVVEHAAPFLVTVPLPSDEDSTWTYDVHVYPKNAVAAIRKGVEDYRTQDQPELSALAQGLPLGSDIGWRIETAVPRLSEGITSYEVTDQLDPRIEYKITDPPHYQDVQVSTVGLVYVDHTGATQSFALSNDEDYTITVEGERASGGQKMTLALTTDGIAAVEQVLSDGGTDLSLVWDFYTRVFEIGDGVIPNHAELSVNGGGALVSNTVSSNWGALKFVKYAKGKDGNKVPLEGATFELYDNMECAAERVKAIKTGTSQPCKGALVSRKFQNSTGQVEDIDSVSWTTDENGEAIAQVTVGVNGTKEQTYYAVETKAPAGYLNANQVYSVTLYAGSVEDAVIGEVENTQVPPTTLPMTGAQISTILVVAVVVLGGGGLALMLSGRRRATGASEKQG